MDDFKSKLQAIDQKKALLIVAGLSLLAFIFFFALPQLDAYVSIGNKSESKGLGFSDIMDYPDKGFLLVLCLMINMLAPIALMVLAYMKSPYHVWIPIVLIFTTLYVGLWEPSELAEARKVLGDAGKIGLSMGIGTIFNLIIYVALSVFCFMRKDMLQVETEVQNKETEE